MKGDMIRETLRRAAGGEPSAGDAFARFEKRARRAALARGSGVLAAGAVAVTALVLTLPGVNSGDPSLVAPGDLTPSAERMQRYVDPVALFEFRYPSDWVARGKHGELAEVYPRLSADEGSEAVLSDFGGSEPRIETPRRFYLQVRAVRFRCPPGGDCVHPFELIDDETDDQRPAGMQMTEAEQSVGGRTARRIDEIFPEAPSAPKDGYTDGWDPPKGSATRAYPPQEWCAGCRVTMYVVDDWVGNWSLVIRAVAPDETSLERHGSDAARIVGTFSGVVEPAAAGS